MIGKIILASVLVVEIFVFFYCWRSKKHSKLEIVGFIGLLTSFLAGLFFASIDATLFTAKFQDIFYLGVMLGVWGVQAIILGIYFFCKRSSK